MFAQFDLCFARFDWYWCSWIYFYAFRFICMQFNSFCEVRFICVRFNLFLCRFDSIFVPFDSFFGPFDLFLGGSIHFLLFWYFVTDFRFICVRFILFILDLKILSVTERHSSRLYKIQGNWEDIVLWHSERQFEAVQFWYVTAGWDRRPRSIEAEFARSEGNFVPRRARLLSLFWPVR